jgi:hypothetical protein
MSKRRIAELLFADGSETYGAVSAKQEVGQATEPRKHEGAVEETGAEAHKTRRKTRQPRELLRQRRHLRQSLQVTKDESAYAGRNGARQLGRPPQLLQRLFLLVCRTFQHPIELPQALVAAE